MSLVVEGLVLTSRTAPAVVSRAGVAMQLERLPGEGDPFSELCPEIDEYGNQVNSIKRGDMGISRWHSDSGYIEDDDEPWHATCKSSEPVLSAAVAEAAFKASLPFIKPESDLVLALSKAKSVEDVDAAVAKCLAGGGRKGCPAIVDAEKLKKAAEKGEFKAGKAPKVGVQGAGWDAMKRTAAKVHDNSIA